MKKDNIPYGSDVSAGTFICADCGFELPIQSTTSLPPCPNSKKMKHVKNSWICISGVGDAVDDPYPDKE